MLNRWMSINRRVDFMPKYTLIDPARERNITRFAQSRVAIMLYIWNWLVEHLGIWQSDMSLVYRK
jgi:hypothetical protein